MKKLLSLLVLSLALCFNYALAQSTVSGKVTDADSGDPLQGVAVVAEGTNTGILTNANGEYKLTVPSSAEALVFSFVGKKSVREVISGRSSIDVGMSTDVLEIEEQVITAFGIAREERALTSSVQAVSGQAVVDSRETNVISGLSGKLSGVQIVNSSGAPGSSSNVVIRGFTSFGQSNQALIVIDGIIVSNAETDNTGDVFSSLGDATFSNRGIDVSPDDIADISVLKGPAATALYGSRAANGVIIITTKKGSSAGSGKKGLNLSYSSTVSFDQVNKLPELNQSYAQGFDSDLAPGISTSWGPLISDLSYDDSGELVFSTDSTATGSPAQVFDRSKFFQTGVKWDQNVSVSGGNLENNGVLSLSRTNQEGVIPLSKFERTSVRAAGQVTVTPKLRLSTNANYINSQTTSTQGGSNVNGVMLGLLRTPPSFDNSNGSDDPTDPSAFILPDGTQRNYRLGGGYDNPYWTVNQNPLTSEVNRFIGNFTLSYKPVKWLDLMYRIGTDTYSDFRKQIFAIGSSGGNASGSVYENAIRRSEINSDIFITLSHQFSDDFSGSLLLGNNLNHRYFQNVYTQGTGLSIPDFYNISNAAAVNSSEAYSIVRLASLFADLRLEYKRMLYLNVTARNDWASTFAADNSFIYPSASVGFVFTEAFGLSENKILPFGKIRMSYAIAGKEPPVYSSSTTYGGGFYGGGFIDFFQTPFLGVTNFTLSDVAGNNTLKPERTSALEVGADLRFFNGRLGIDLTYYRQVSKDQIIAVNVPASSGFSSLIKNAGEVLNQGIELTVNGTPVKTESGFRWDIDLNFTKNTSEVKEISAIDGLDFINVGEANFSSISSRAIVGQPYGVFFGGVFDRTSDGRYVVDAAGYPVEAAESQVVGDPNPDWMMGLGNTLSFKGLRLYALLDIRKGGDMWNGTRGALYYFGAHADTEQNRLNNTTQVFDAVTSDSYYGNEDNPSAWVTNTTEVPLDINWHLGATGSGFTGPTEQFIEDGGWVRLRELTLGYKLPANILESTPIGGVELFLTGRNLWLKTDYTGIDPETSLRGQTNGLGWDYFNQPGTKSYVIGVKVSL